MRVVYIAFFMMLSVSCADDFITNTTPFKNLECRSDSSSFSMILSDATRFASVHHFRQRLSDYSTTLTTDRLNFIVTAAPTLPGHPFFASGISRTPPTRGEMASFDQFVASLPLACTPAKG